jgi:RNA polymerase sigma-70 factor (ECF subfamily)
MVAATTPSPGDQSERMDAERATISRREALVDAALVRRFNDGDEAAFVEIVGRHRNRLFVIALDMLRNHADAEEIAQDTLIRAHRALDRFRGDSSLSTWLCCITLNLSRNRFRYHQRRQRHASISLNSTISDDNSETFAEIVACGAPSPVREAVNKEFAVAVTACTDRLPPNQREILTLRTRQHKSYRAISELLGIDTGTVKSRIARARSALRELVAKAYPEFDRSAHPSGPFECLRPEGRVEALGA